MISTQEALAVVLGQAPLFKKKLIQIPLQNSVGFLLSKDLKAQHNSPPFDQSAMDGYALIYEDITSGGVIKFDPKNENSAGVSKIKKIEKGTAVRIFTGAKIPANADIVIPQENIQLTEDGILVFDRNTVKKMDNIRLKGSQFKKGEVILHKNEKINSPRIAIAASAGYAKLPVYSFPKASIIVSGNELIKPGQPLNGDKIYESNSLMLHALLKEYKIPVNKILYTKDKKESIRTAIHACLKNSELIFVSGGISVGKYDLVKESLLSLKVKTIFHKVKQKPGKPLYFGKKGNAFVFGLPGNPAASLTCFHEYVIPFIRSICGEQEALSEIKKTQLITPYTKKPGLTHFLKGRLSEKGLSILPDQESYKLTSFAYANCLIVIPEDSSEVKEGELLEYHNI